MGIYMDISVSRHRLHKYQFSPLMGVSNICLGILGVGLKGGHGSLLWFCGRDNQILIMNHGPLFPYFSNKF